MISATTELRDARALKDGYLLTDSATIAAVLSIPVPDSEKPLPLAAVVNRAEHRRLRSIAKAAGLSKEQVKLWAQRYLFLYNPGSPTSKAEAIERARQILARRVVNGHVFEINNLSTVRSKFGRSIETLLNSYGIVFDDYKKQQTFIDALYEISQA